MKQTIDDLHIFTLHTGYAEHNGDWNWKNVRSPFARLYYVTEGQAQVIIHSSKSQEEEETIHLRPGCLYFIPPFTLHSNVCDGIFKHYYIHVLENPANSFHYLTEYTYPREVKAQSMDIELFKSICSINPFLSLSISNPTIYDNDTSLTHNIDLGNQRPVGDKVESRGILYILMSRFIREAKQNKKITDPRIIRAIDYINSHMNLAINVDEIAEEAAMSKDYFIRIFRKETGMTPVIFATKRKMERAETLLTTTKIPIKSIAFNLGYEDTSYFYRIFKKNVGKSPQQYRDGSH